MQHHLTTPAISGIAFTDGTGVQRARGGLPAVHTSTHSAVELRLGGGGCFRPPDATCMRLLQPPVEFNRCEMPKGMRARMTPPSLGLASLSPPQWAAGGPRTHVYTILTGLGLRAQPTHVPTSQTCAAASLATVEGVYKAAGESGGGISTRQNLQMRICY